MAYFLIIIGSAAVIGSFFIDEFYSGDVLSVSGFEKERKLATWYGRFLFILVGLMFTLGGILILHSSE